MPVLPDCHGSGIRFGSKSGAAGTATSSSGSGDRRLVERLVHPFLQHQREVAALSVRTTMSRWIDWPRDIWPWLPKTKASVVDVLAVADSTPVCFFERVDGTGAPCVLGCDVDVKRHFEMQRLRELVARGGTAPAFDVPPHAASMPVSVSTAAPAAPRSSIACGQTDWSSASSVGSTTDVASGIPAEP